MTSFNPLSIAFDAWRVTRGGSLLLARRQQERLAELVAFARAHSRFYAEKYRGLPETITNARQLPPVTKLELMEHFDEVVTDPDVRKTGVEAFLADQSTIGQAYLDRYMVWTTSGTTGTPGIFLEDKAWDTVITAVNLTRIGLEWYTPEVIRGMLKRGGMTAAVFAGNGHFLGVSMIERQRRSRASRARSMHLIPVTLPIPEIVQRLNELQPAMFSGYASALALLAQEQLAGRLKIQPSIVVSSAEPLSDENRALIQQAFGVPPRNNYSCSEGGVMGYECHQGNMHLNTDWVLFEPVDENYQPVTPGQFSSRVLITNLANRVMPIIRYELGDRVSLDPEPCNCGITLPVVNVEGRTDEILRFESANGQTIPVLPLALWAIIKETPGVLRFQAIQTAPGALKIRLETKPFADRVETWDKVEARVREYLQKQGLGNVTIIRATEAPMRDPKSGKFRNVWTEKG
ncbi:MAG: phenylacetate--CoA ligase family protein [Anaerolineae bacterium]|nr:phenylacetate--CoA ligase family protein [Anaerolineae bacterium]